MKLSLNGRPFNDTNNLIALIFKSSTTKGVNFITPEDKTGTTNLVVVPDVFYKYRKEILHAILLTGRGRDS